MTTKVVNTCFTLFRNFVCRKMKRPTYATQAPLRVSHRYADPGKRLLTRPGEP
jgi:hypothetical protein